MGVFYYQEQDGILYAYIDGLNLEECKDKYKTIPEKLREKWILESIHLDQKKCTCKYFAF